MPDRLVVVFYISGHGFGHAARDTVVINALGRRVAGLEIVVRTGVPRWFIDAALDTAVEIVDGAVDTGVAQPDSLTIDEDETAQRAAEFYAAFGAHVEREAAVLRGLRATLVVGDVPPLAFAAAARAGVPSVALANFTWDWIYDGFPGFRQSAPGVIETIARAYALATITLRLPFSGGFASMRNVVDVPLVGRRASVPAHEVRRRLALESDIPLVLASFGGHGRAIPLDRAVAPNRFTIVATDYESPASMLAAGLRIIDSAALSTASVTYTDLLAACDVVATKLGYGIVADCIINDVPMLYTFRGRFVEQQVFDRQLPAVLRCRAISRDDLVAGQWLHAIEALLAQPAPTANTRVDGAEVVADRIAEIARAV